MEFRRLAPVIAMVFHESHNNDWFRWIMIRQGLASERKRRETSLLNRGKVSLKTQGCAYMASDLQAMIW